jgi:hypothetical protein
VDVLSLLLEEDVALLAEEEDLALMELAGGHLHQTDHAEDEVFRRMLKAIREQWLEVAEAEDDDEEIAAIEERHFSSSEGSTISTFDTAPYEAEARQTEPTFRFREEDCEEVYGQEMERLEQLHNPSNAGNMEPVIPLLKKAKLERYSARVQEEVSDSGLQLMGLAIDDR